MLVLGSLAQAAPASNSISTHLKRLKQIREEYSVLTDKRRAEMLKEHYHSVAFTLSHATVNDLTLQIAINDELLAAYQTKFKSDGGFFSLPKTIPLATASTLLHYANYRLLSTEQKQEIIFNYGDSDLSVGASAVFDLNYRSLFFQASLEEREWQYNAVFALFQGIQTARIELNFDVVMAVKSHTQLFALQQTILNYGPLKFSNPNRKTLGLYVPLIQWADTPEKVQIYQILSRQHGSKSQYLSNLKVPKSEYPNIVLELLADPSGEGRQLLDLMSQDARHVRVVTSLNKIGRQLKSFGVSRRHLIQLMQQLTTDAQVAAIERYVASVQQISVFQIDQVTEFFAIAGITEHIEFCNSLLEH